ncbi:uncharacterized protein BDW70DRAFT_140671 [Aspergillus foveolatus]|uniref:uncharacterized protein n=1 Tax=Aspergillus foveolatus TaxID=210207 RepID=UPI003CCC9752
MWRLLLVDKRASFFSFCLSCSCPPRLTVRSLSDCVANRSLTSHQPSLLPAFGTSLAHCEEAICSGGYSRPLAWLVCTRELVVTRFQRTGGLRLDSCSNPRMGSSSRERN